MMETVDLRIPTALAQAQELLMQRKENQQPIRAVFLFAKGAFKHSKRLSSDAKEIDAALERNISHDVASKAGSFEGLFQYFLETPGLLFKSQDTKRKNLLVTLTFDK